MKVALCISGHLRSFKDAFPTLKRAILEPFEPDVFIFTWNTVGFDGGSRGDGHLVDAPVDPEMIAQLFRPRKILVYAPMRWATSKYRQRMGKRLRNPEILCGMFYGIHQANLLRKNFSLEKRVAYDVVIRTRPDLYFRRELDPAEIKSCRQTNGVFFPNFGNFGGLNDQFAFGGSESMDIYSKTYLHLDRYFNLGCLWHPESLTKFNLEYCKIPILRSGTQYDILRANGEFTRQGRKRSGLCASQSLENSVITR